MLMKIKDFWPRTEGQGWNIPKFHEQLHVPDDILQNGSPAGTHSGPVEHNHIHFVKHLSRWTQKKRETIDYQIASRTYENDIINNAAYSMNILTKDIETKETQSNTGPTLNSSSSILRITNQNENCHLYNKQYEIV